MLRSNDNANLLRLEKVCINFSRDNLRANAVNNINLNIQKGAITCLVGESGCGKSLTAKAILKLTPDNSAIEGNIFYNNQDILELDEISLQKIRGKKISMIFQEPMTALNPVLTVGFQAAEPLRLHLNLSKHEARKKVEELFTSVGIPDAKIRYDAYPHELSGGMRQRVMIAMALACEPELLLADEPTTALDATIQGQILHLIKKANTERNMAVLLITHDLGVVKQMADYVGVMYAGHIIEYGKSKDIIKNPMHPYTIGLINASPNIHTKRPMRLKAIDGYVPDIFEMPKGCPFAPRCNYKMDICSQKMPDIKNINGHEIACYIKGS